MCNHRGLKGDFHLASEVLRSSKEKVSRWEWLSSGRSEEVSGFKMNSGCCRFRLHHTCPARSPCCLCARHVNRWVMRVLIAFWVLLTPEQTLPSSGDESGYITGWLPAQGMFAFTASLVRLNGALTKSRLSNCEASTHLLGIQRVREWMSALTLWSHLVCMKLVKGEMTEQTSCCQHQDPAECWILWDSTVSL